MPKEKESRKKQESILPKINPEGYLDKDAQVMIATLLDWSKKRKPTNKKNPNPTAPTRKKTHENITNANSPHREKEKITKPPPALDRMPNKTIFPSTHLSKESSNQDPSELIKDMGTTITRILLPHLDPINKGLPYPDKKPVQL